MTINTHPLTIYQAQILRRYHIVLFIMMWCLGWGIGIGQCLFNGLQTLINLSQSIVPYIDTGLDLVGMMIVALVSIPILFLLNGLRVAL